MATVRLQLRRGLADDWFDANPTLAAGEIGIETDTNTFKFGDGQTAWNDLEYALSGTVDDYIALSTKGVANGVASLDGSGLVPLAQLPGAAALDAEVATAVSNHNNVTTSVHGIADTSLLVTTTGSQTLMSKSLTSPALTGTPTAPTAAAGTDTTQVATTAFVQDAIELVIGAAPEALNTLAEIATSLADNADLSGTLTTSISNKVAKSGDTMSGALNMGTNKITNLAAPTTSADAANKAYTDGTIDNYIINHAAISTNIHGISDAANLVYTSDVRLSDLRVPQDNSVATEKIVDLNVTTAKISDSAITSAKIADGSVSTVKIADLAVTTAKLADSGVTSGKLGDSSVTVAKIDTGAVETAKIADQAVTTAKLADLAVTGAKIADNSISQSHLSDDSVGTNEIGGLAVTTGKLADSAVTTDKINNSAVTEGKIAGLAVTEGKIADGAVSTVKIADSAITTGKLANDSVTTGKIAADTIVNADISPSAAIAQSKIDGLGAALDLKAPLANPTFTGTVSGITKSMVGLGDVDNTTDALKPVSTATQTALDLKANSASPTFTGTVVLPTVTAGGNIVPNVDNTYDLGSPTLMWKDIYVGPGSLYVNGQKVLQDESGAIVVSADINENLGLRTSGSGNIEFDPTGTGSINIKGPVVVEAGANFSSADGNGVGFSNGLKSDSVMSRSLDTDLSLSANGSGKVYLNDNAEVNGNLVVGGNLTVSGTTTTVNSETISLADNIIDLNSNFTTGTPTENAGLRVVRGDSNAVQIRWNESTDKWEFTSNGSDYSVIAPTDSPTFTGTVGGVTKSMVGLANVDNTSDASKPVSTATQTALDTKLNTSTASSTYAPIANPTFTGTVTVAASGVAFTDGTQTKQGVPSLTTIASATTGAYNLSTGGLGLRDQLIPIGGTHVITVPTNTTTAFPIGTSISFYQSAGTGGSFAGADVSVSILSTPGSTLRALYSSATLTKVATNTWLLAGDLRA